MATVHPQSPLTIFNTTNNGGCAAQWWTPHDKPQQPTPHPTCTRPLQAQLRHPRSKPPILIEFLFSHFFNGFDGTKREEYTHTKNKKKLKKNENEKMNKTEKLSRAY
jgi:hypothetical protein